jgi:membrane protein
MGKELHAAGVALRDVCLRLVHTLIAFYAKVTSDWIFSLSALLAYNLLMSTLPSVLVMIAAAGFILGALSPSIVADLTAGIVHQLPPGVGQPLVDAAVASLKEHANIALAFGLVSAAFFVSRLFIVIEDCFGIIFVLPSRSLLRQNLMAFKMMLLYLVVLPFIFLGGTLVDGFAALVLGDRARTMGGLIFLFGLGVNFLAAALLFGTIYLVVPNQAVRLRQVWKGTLTSAALLVVYRILFPLYQARFLTATDPASLIGLVVVVLIFFYYLGAILLLGAEVNAWAAGQRTRQNTVDSILHGQRPA